MSEREPQGEDLLASPIEFWERRHAAGDAWRSGGDRGLSVTENYEFYAYRLGRIVELIRRHASVGRGLHVLDAGCGRGHFTDGLRRCGHRVTGIDASASAVAWARQAYGSHFQCCALDRHHPSTLYDVILSIDVLFHLLDDQVWLRSLHAFARYARAECVLILTDTFTEDRFQLGDYIVHRAADEYDRALAPYDFERVRFVPYHFGSNANGFAVYVRRLG